MKTKTTNRLLTLNHSYTLIAPAAGWERQVGYWLVASDRVAGLFASMGRLDWNEIEIDGEFSYRVDPFVRAGDEPRLGGDPATFGISPDTLIANVRFTTGCGGRVRSADDFERYVETLEVTLSSMATGEDDSGSDASAADLEDAAAVQHDDADDLARTVADKPEQGKVYRLAGDGTEGSPSIASGDSWAESEVKDE